MRVRLRAGERVKICSTEDGKLPFGSCYTARIREIRSGIVTSSRASGVETEVRSAIAVVEPDEPLTVNGRRITSVGLVPRHKRSTIHAARWMEIAVYANEMEPDSKVLYWEDILSICVVRLIRS